MSFADYATGTPAVITGAAEMRAKMVAVWNAVASMLEEGGAEIRIKAVDQRTAQQNDRMWAMLADISRQVQWYGTKLSPDEWKDVFSASLKRQKVVPGLDGGFVVIGGRTSKMSKRGHSDLMELITAFGNDPERKVVWSDPKWAHYEKQMARAA